MFNYEDLLVELAQTNDITVEVEGYSFKAYTLCDTHKELLQSCESREELLDEVSNIALRVRDSRAIEFKGMTEDKLTKFWANGEYEEFVDPSLRHAFAENALEQSNMFEVLERFEPVVLDGDNLPDSDIELDNLEAQLAADRALAN